MAFRDWPRTLRPASYRGAKFFVEKDTVESGRRLVIHQFPLRDEPYVEDLGRDAIKMSVTAYVLGDSADSQASSLLSACGTKGPGRLSLPISQFQAHCEKASRDFSKDRQGYIAFSLSFVREGGGAAPMPVAALSNAVSVVAGGLRAAARSMVLARFVGLRIASFVQESAIAAVRDIATALEVVRAGAPLDPEDGPEIARDIQALYDDAEDLIRIGQTGDRHERRAFVAEAEDETEAELVDRVFDIVEGLGSAMEPDAGADLLAQLLDYDIPRPVSFQETVSRRLEAENLAVLAALARLAALAEWAVALADRTYTDRRAAIQARADAAERIEAEMHRLSGYLGHAAWLALDELRGTVAELLTRQVTDLAPVKVVSTNRTMPALWWANRLYGDATRATEIAERNRVINPAFMPRDIEALAS